MKRITLLAVCIVVILSSMEFLACSTVMAQDKEVKPAAEKSGQAAAAGKGSPVSDLLVGRRVRVFLTRDTTINGTVKQVERTQIYLTHATSDPLSGLLSNVLIDTSSGGFAYLEIVPKVTREGELTTYGTLLFGHTAAAVKKGDVYYWLDYSGNEEIIKKKITSFDKKTVVVTGVQEIRNIGVSLPPERGGGEGAKAPARTIQTVIVVESLKAVGE